MAHPVKITCRQWPPIPHICFKAFIIGHLQHRVAQIINNGLAFDLTTIGVVHRKGIGSDLDIIQILLRAAVAALLARAHRRAFDGTPGVHMLAQPEATLAHGFLTRAEFMRGAGRLNPGGRQPEADILHANALYGALVLEQAVAAARRECAGFSENCA